VGIKKVEFYKHNIGEEDVEALKEVVATPMLSQGKWVERAEEKLSKYLGIPHIVCVSSCTDALFLSLKASGVKKGDEVITTPFTFIATVNAIEYCGGKPIFADVQEETGNINSEEIQKKISKKTKAILPVHIYGTLCNMVGIDVIAHQHKISIIEDCAHALDTTGAGLWGLSCYSFYPTKSITCGEGGAVGCWHEDVAEKLKILRNHGMNKMAWKRYEGKYEHWEMEELGYKMNMTNLQGCLLLRQLDNINNIVATRKERYDTYYEAFRDNPKIKLLHSDKGSSKLYFSILVDGDKRDNIVWQLQDKGIGVVVNWRPVHLRQYYARKYGYKEGDFPQAEDIGRRTISIPLYSKLTAEEQKYVIKCVEDVIGGKSLHFATSPKRGEDNSKGTKRPSCRRAEEEV